ncbi:MAG: SlyX family protein [Methylomonas sp.]|jgi:SlyX protein
MIEKRIIELEIKQAYQEDLLQALNNVAASQQQQIGRLEETCKLLHEKLKSLADSGHDSPAASEKPPHY